MQVRNSIWMKFDCVRFCSEILTPRPGSPSNAAAGRCSLSGISSLREGLATRRRACLFPFRSPQCPCKRLELKSLRLLGFFGATALLQASLQKGSTPKKAQR